MWPLTLSVKAAIFPVRSEHSVHSERYALCGRAFTLCCFPSSDGFAHQPFCALFQGFHSCNSVVQTDALSGACCLLYRQTHCQEPPDTNCMNLMPLYGYVLRVISLRFTFFGIWCGLCMAGVLCLLQYVACIFLCGIYLWWNWGWKYKRQERLKTDFSTNLMKALFCKVLYCDEVP